MNYLIESVNALGCGLISLSLMWAILSPKVHDGVVIKIGLIGMALGFGSIALRLVGGIQPHDIPGLERSLLLINAGIAVVIVGYLMRKARSGHSARRSSDWAEFDDAPSMQWPDIKDNQS